MRLLFCLWGCFLPLLSHSSRLQGISELSTPSLVILGTAKGGTTDIWELLHILHRGFATYSPVEYSNLCPCRIRPWKELMFFNDKYDYCYGTDNIRKWCDVAELSILLRCPTSVFINQSQSHRTMVSLCDEELRKRKVPVPTFTATASPLLLQFAKSGSDALMKIYRETKSPPLFAVLLRDPTKATISLYNHGMQMNMQSTAKRYSLPLEQILAVEFELLSRPTLLSSLMVIRRTAMRMAGWGDIIACADAFRELQILMQTAFATYRPRGIQQPPSSATSAPVAADQRLSGRFLSDIASGKRTSTSAAGKSVRLEQRHPSRSIPPGSRAAVQIQTRRYGLLLNSLYVPQLCSWLVTDILNATEARLVISRSEYVFQDRLRFFLEEFVPFLHPNEAEMRKYIVSNSSALVQELPIANKKPGKIKWAELSSEMTTKARRFFEVVPVQPLLTMLTQMNSDKYVIVPKLHGNDSQWWSDGGV